ncbi:hypothetical protein G3545_12205 [Starkeya sp. ORNL1]|uniref:hypothetical protein n=1 Tax=Starkeya sp. ORNL1 TaxID=2709380 RepID=UPI0014645246|nr:hypothetical protein [Starkeya sp. ORNL1]QJP14338.1 hypothetical protein G3545_12205 [Starkeya sp. ORNL1]
MCHHVRERETCIPNRRAALRTLALGVAGVALPAAAFALTPEPHPDAELIRLGEAFDRQHAAWVPLWKESDRLEKATFAAIEAAGIKFDLATYEWHCARTGFDVAADANVAAVDVLRRLAEQIAAIPARSYAGLHAKARVVFWECIRPADYIDVAEEALDGDVLSVIGLLREIESLAAEART